MNSRIFDKKGMMIIPNPQTEEIPAKTKALVVNKLFCPNGHNLINNRAKFNGYAGIILKVKHKDNEGIIALSPVYGEKNRVSFGIDLNKGDLLEINCPECNVALPVHSPCACGAEMIAMFHTQEADFSNCVGICNRIDCVNAEITSNGELISQAIIEKMET